jgi:hypothetical protein
VTSNEFSRALLADPFWNTDGSTRVRYILSDALYVRAKELKGRPDRAARLRWLAGGIEHGQLPTKRVLGKCCADIEVVRDRMVDGHPLSDKQADDATSHFVTTARFSR